MQNGLGTFKKEREREKLGEFGDGVNLGGIVRMNINIIKVHCMKFSKIL